MYVITILPHVKITKTRRCVDAVVDTDYQVSSSTPQIFSLMGLERPTKHGKYRHCIGSRRKSKIDNRQIERLYAATGCEV